MKHFPGINYSKIDFLPTIQPTSHPANHSNKIYENILYCLVETGTDKLFGCIYNIIQFILLPYAINLSV